MQIFCFVSYDKAFAQLYLQFCNESRITFYARFVKAYFAVCSNRAWLAVSIDTQLLAIGTFGATLALINSILDKK